MKIVVSGALGFVGVNLSVFFLKRGFEVIGIDNKFKDLGSYNNQQLFEKNGGKLFHVDIRNNNDVDHFFKNNDNIDVVYNLAAQVAFKNSIENPRFCLLYTSPSPRDPT